MSMFCQDSARHVLYLNFMSSDFNGYSPDGDALAAASPECLEAREAFRKQLRALQRTGGLVP